MEPLEKITVCGNLHNCVQVSFLCNENPRFERGFRKLKAMSPFVRLHGRIVEGLPTATKEKENTNGQEYFSTYHMGM